MDGRRRRAIGFEFSDGIQRGRTLEQVAVRWHIRVSLDLLTFGYLSNYRHICIDIETGDVSKSLLGAAEQNPLPSADIAVSL